MAHTSRPRANDTTPSRRHHGVRRHPCQPTTRTPVPMPLPGPPNCWSAPTHARRSIPPCLPPSADGQVEGPPSHHRTPSSALQPHLGGLLGRSHNSSRTLAPGLHGNTQLALLGARAPSAEPLKPNSKPSGSHLSTEGCTNTHAMPPVQHADPNDHPRQRRRYRQLREPQSARSGLLPAVNMYMYMHVHTYNYKCTDAYSDTHI